MFAEVSCGPSGSFIQIKNVELIEVLTKKLCMFTGGENSLILIKLYIYVQVFYMVRLPSKKKSLPIDPFFSGMLPETFFYFFLA